MTNIEFVNGDLLEATENLIVHQVNCKSKMGSGIAVQVKKKWYNVYQEYTELCGSCGVSENLLGHAQIVNVGNGQSVVNLFGQDDYGYMGARFTNYEALYSGLEIVASIARQRNLSVAIPFAMGSDRGGADWRIVYAMIECLFEKCSKPVTIYKLQSKGEN